MKSTSKIILAGLALVGVTLASQAAPASENWENYCQKCHGADGKGETKTGKKLNVKDYTDAAVQAGMKDDEMAKVIADGAIGKNGKERMKAFKDDLSSDEINDLVAFIRKFKA
jgi:cytochrome c553